MGAPPRACARTPTRPGPHRTSTQLCPLSTLGRLFKERGKISWGACVSFLSLSLSLFLCVCTTTKLYITAQSSPIFLAIVCHSHCWSSQGWFNDTYYENPRSDATKGTHFLYLYSSYLSTECIALPSLPPCYFLDFLIRQLLNQPFLACVFFCFRPSLLCFPQIASTTPPRFLALLHLSSALHDPTPRLPSLGSGPQHDATVSPKGRVMRLWLLVTRWRRPPSRVFRPTSITISQVPRLSLPSPLISISAPALTPISSLLVLLPVLVLPPVPALVPVFSPSRPW